MPGARPLANDITGRAADVVVLRVGSEPSRQQVRTFGDLLPMSANPTLHSCFRRLDDNAAALKFAAVARDFLAAHGLVTIQQFDDPLAPVMISDDPTTPGVEIVAVATGLKSMTAAEINAGAPVPANGPWALVFIDGQTLTPLDAGFAQW